MKLSTSFVAVKKINSKVERSEFLDDKLNQVAKLILKAEGIINPLVLRRTSLDSYEVIDGHFEYYAAAKAREIDPFKGEMIGAFILEPENEDILQEQAKVLRKQKHIGQLEKNERSTNTETELVSNQIYQYFDESIKIFSNDISQKLADVNREIESIKLDRSYGDIKLIENFINEKIEAIFQKIKLTEGDESHGKIKNIENTLNQQLEQLESINRDIKSIIEGNGGKAKKDRLNLLTAEREEISDALKQIGFSNQTLVTAACEAVEYWQTPGKKLIWENLKKSTKSGSDKIKGFADGTYRKLEEVGYIPGEEAYS